MPALQIPNHMHCAICNQAIPYTDPRKASHDEKTCTPEHAAQYTEREKKRRRQVLIMYGLMAAAFVVLVLTYVSPGTFGGA